MLRKFSKLPENINNSKKSGKQTKMSFSRKIKLYIYLLVQLRCVLRLTHSLGLEVRHALIMRKTSGSSDLRSLSTVKAMVT